MARFGQTVFYSERNGRAFNAVETPGKKVTCCSAYMKYIPMTTAFIVAASLPRLQARQRIKVGLGGGGGQCWGENDPAPEGEHKENSPDLGVYIQWPGYHGSELMAILSNTRMKLKP